MKKLLSLSILAATLASTAAFAQPVPVVAGAMGNNEPTKLVISQKASGPTVELFQIVQTLNSSVTNNNHLKAIVINLDDQGNFSKAKLTLVQALADQDHDAIQAALMSSARTTNHNLGWQAVKVVAGNGSTLATIYAIDSVQDSNNVHAYLIHNERNQVTITEVKADQAQASELQSAKNGANLNPVVAKHAHS